VKSTNHDLANVQRIHNALDARPRVCKAAIEGRQATITGRKQMASLFGEALIPQIHELLIAQA
jgi:hypothetical protein